MAEQTDIEILKQIYKQKLDSINAILKNAPYTPLASTATPAQVQTLIDAIDAATDKLNI